MKRLMYGLLATTLTGCAIASGFEGPGYDPEVGLLGDQEGPLLAVITHTEPASGAGKEFGDAVNAVVDQLATQPGFVGHALRGQIGGRQRWTLTVWEDEESLVAFTVEGAHLEAMLDSADLIKGVTSVAYTLETTALPPSWDDALERLAAVEPDEPW